MVKGWSNGPTIDRMSFERSAGYQFLIDQDFLTGGANGVALK